MYIELVRRVVEAAVKTFADANGQTVQGVLAEIRGHIDKTSGEYWKDEPNIAYDNPLCRIGYLYRHATANATLFEQALRSSAELQQKLHEADQRTLQVCTVGGGPGTELLALGKHLLPRSTSFLRRFRRSTPMPRKIVFTVLDNVPHWAETWQQLAEAVEDTLRSALAGERGQPPTIAPTFLPMDVLNGASYRGYAYQFGRADIVIFNYLFSENKTRLDEAQEAVNHLARACPAGCVIVVLDRLERNPAFSDGVRQLFENALGVQITARTFDGTLDGDEQTSDMGDTLIAALGNPRVKFFTDANRDPTVFWFTVVRG